MKKNVFEAFDLVKEICGKSTELDLEAAKCLICMLIDTTSAVHGEDAKDIAKQVFEAVSQVNDEFGAY